MSNEPLSAQWYECATRWAEAEAAADLLETTKSAVLAQMMARCQEKSVASKELIVKAGSEWSNHVKKIAEARRQANLLKVQAEYLKMQYWESSSHAATERAMARMS